MRRRTGVKVFILCNNGAAQLFNFVDTQFSLMRNLRARLMLVVDEYPHLDLP